MTTLNEGEVEIALSAQPLTLRPTLAAMTALNRLYSGFGPLQARLMAQDVDAIVNTIRIGANLKDDAAKRLDRRVFTNGLTPELIIPLIRYVDIVANGGKPRPDGPDGGPDFEAADPEGNG